MSAELRELLRDVENFYGTYRPRIVSSLFSKDVLKFVSFYIRAVRVNVDVQNKTLLMAGARLFMVRKTVHAPKVLKCVFIRA